MILTSRGGGNVEILMRAKEWPGFAYGANPLTVPPPSWSANSDDPMGVPAAFAAVRIAADGVAGMCAGVYRGDGLDRIEVNTTWQARFFDGQPNDQESWNSVWSQTEASLTAENNGYWWLNYDSSMRISSVQVIDPMLVKPKLVKGQKVFDVQTSTGKQTVDSSRILHFRGTGNPGDIVAPNPCDQFAEAIGAALNRQAYENSFYENGMGQGLALIYPSDMTPSQAREYRDALGPAQGGISNKVRVFGGGPTIQGIGISPRDAQFIEAMNFTVEDISRIYNVPASILGAGGGRSMSMPLSPEHELTRWLRYGLAPRLGRIAAAINHSPAFFGVGARDEFAWETQNAIHGDVATEDLIAHQQIQDGRITVNEWRASEGLPPLPGGNIPLLTPVGAAPNPGAAVVGTGGLEPATEPAAELGED